MYMVRSVGVCSVAKIAGLIYGCLGLIFAPFFLPLGLLGAFAGQGKSPFAGVFGVAVAIIMPIAYGGMGLIMGAIGGMLYNIFCENNGRS